MLCSVIQHYITALAYIWMLKCAATGGHKINLVTCFQLQQDFLHHPKERKYLISSIRFLWVMWQSVTTEGAEESFSLNWGKFTCTELNKYSACNVILLS